MFCRKPVFAGRTGPNKRARTVILRAALLVIAFALPLATPGQAQLAVQWNFCTGSEDIDWNTQIKNCTALIQSNRETKQNRSIAFINRGLAYYTLKDFDHAISD